MPKETESGKWPYTGQYYRSLDWLVKIKECSKIGHDWREIKPLMLTTAYYTPDHVGIGITRNAWQCARCDELVSEFKPDPNTIVTPDGHLETFLKWLALEK